MNTFILEENAAKLTSVEKGKVFALMLEMLTRNPQMLTLDHLHSFLFR